MPQRNSLSWIFCCCILFFFVFQQKLERQKDSFKLNLHKFISLYNGEEELSSFLMGKRISYFPPIPAALKNMQNKLPNKRIAFLLPDKNVAIFVFDKVAKDDASILNSGKKVLVPSKNQFKIWHILSPFWSFNTVENLIKTPLFLIYTQVTKITLSIYFFVQKKIYIIVVVQNLDVQPPTWCTWFDKLKQGLRNNLLRHYLLLDCNVKGRKLHLFSWRKLLFFVLASTWTCVFSCY